MMRKPIVTKAAVPTVEPSDIAERIDEIADAFESEWKSGSRPKIEAFLSRVPAHAKSQALSELVLLDVEYRRRSGEQPSFKEYQEEFPLLFLDPSTDPRVRPAANASAHRPVADFSKVGKYTVLSELAREGQAEVFRAVHPLGMPVVLKFCRPDLTDAAHHSLIEEARILAQLKHPHIAPVLDLDWHEGRPFIAISYVHGQNLEQYVAGKTLTYPQIALLCSTIARALSAAHRVGVAHLDIKPRNIVIDQAGEPHLIDFGIARVRSTFREDTTPGLQPTGTIPYMAPEQAIPHPDQINTRTDLFGMGAVLYFLLTGKAPFHAANRTDALAKAKDGTISPLPAKTPAALASICLKAMAARPQDRHQDADELADTLEGYARPRFPARRAVAVIAGVVFAGLIVWGIVASRSAPPPVAPPAPTASATLQVNVEKNREWISIEQIPQLQIGASKLQVSAQIPPGVNASLFLVDNEGAVGRLTDLPKTSTDRLMIYPSGNNGVQIQGIPGNCALIVLTHPDRVITDNDLRILLPSLGWPTPPLPSGILVTATGEKIQTINTLGARASAVVPVETADAATRQFLTGLRERALADRYGVSAVATYFAPAPK